MSLQNSRKVWGSFKSLSETKQPQELKYHKSDLGQLMLPKGHKENHFSQNYNVPF